MKCSPRYTKIFDRIDIVHNELEEEVVMTANRIVNFLPYAMKTFERLREKDRCVPLGDCSAAMYVAFFYHMLSDFTTMAPDAVIENMTRALPPTTNAKLLAKLGEQKYNNYITPEAFGDMMDLLWEDKDLNLLQYSSGSCADWIRMAYAVRGPHHNWKCDQRWEKLITRQFCRPKHASNLDECAGGEGVCYINGETDGVCGKQGLSEMTLYNHECQRRYGQIPAFCCKKKPQDIPETTMTFYSNEYHNLRIAIDPMVQESAELIANLKKTFTRASAMLYEATGFRAVFRSIRILLPHTWSANLATEPRGEEKVSGAEFYVKRDVNRDLDGIDSTRITMSTIQFGYCGSRGLGTQLTPRDISGKNSAANVVKHFAFNRYGIFREFPRSENELELKDALNKFPPRCVQDNSTTYLYCNGSFDVLISSDSKATGSIAWIPDYADYPGLEKIVHFCDGRDCDEHRHHNKDIDNTQNRICDKRATLDVILDSADFNGAGYPPRHGMNTQPVFKIVHPNYERDPNPPKPSGDDTRPPALTTTAGSPLETVGNTELDTHAPTTMFYDFTTMGHVNIETTMKPKTPKPSPPVQGPKRIVLVLDESGSMSDNNKIGNLKAAAGQFVDMTDPSIEVAVVSFAGSSRVLSQLKQGTADGKAQLKQAIFSLNANGGTCIQEGMNDALRLLAATGQKGGQIILMTDGENNCGGDYIEMTKHGLRAQEAVVHTCAITASADGALKLYADMMHGKSFLITNGNDVVSFIQEMQALLSAATEDSSTDKVTLMNEVIEVTAHKQVEQPIFLDKGLGKQNLITVMYNKNEVSSMSGEMVSPDKAAKEVPCQDESNYGKMNCELALKPTPGQWTLRMRPVSVNSQETKTKVTVTASATVNKTESDTFSIVGTILKPTIYTGRKDVRFWEKDNLDHAQAFVATVSFGRFAVLGATVKAHITYQDGSKWSVDLSDNGEAYRVGKGADLYENDGIYTALSDSFPKKEGRYSVVLEVVAEEKKAYYTRDVLLGIPKAARYMQQTEHLVTPVTFKRMLSIGMFEVRSGARGYMPLFAHDDNVAVRRMRTGENVGITYRNAEEAEVHLPRPGRVTGLTLRYSSVDQDFARFSFIFNAVGRDGMASGFPSYYLLNVSTNILAVQGRGEEIEVSPLVDTKFKFDYIPRRGEDADEPGMPVVLTAKLPMSKWRKATKLYFSASAYNYDEYTEEWMAGPHSNIVVSGIDQSALNVCSSDGTGNCASTPSEGVPFFLKISNHSS